MKVEVKSLLQRQQKLTQALTEAGLEGMAVNAGPSLSYLTGLGFHMSERPVVGLFTENNAPTFVLPEMEAGKLEKTGYEVQFFTYGEDPHSWQTAFNQGAKAAGIGGGAIGVETRIMRVLELRFLEAAMPKAKFEGAEEVIAGLRMQKDAAEIAAMEKAVKIAEKAMEATLPLIQVGMSEAELASELTLQLYRQKTAPKLPFSPIVAGGPNSGKPHAIPTERKLKQGDLLLVDWGANSGGYFSDMTRCYAVGEVEEELKRIHKVVEEANAAGRAKAGPGVSCAAVDRAARKVIEAAGYGKYFTHRTGHGLGMEIHEEPYMRGDNEMELKPGMSFTIEPGIYLPGRGGVRVEDNVVVTEKGLKTLTNLPRELTSIG